MFPDDLPFLLVRGELMRGCRLLILATMACYAGGLASGVQAGDWPQILGPGRNGVAHGEQLAPWNEKGPERLWSSKLGSGFAGPVVADGKVLLFHRVDDQERVQALHAVSGKPLWETSFPASYGGGFTSDSGPRCTPLVADGRVFVLGAAADLHCLALADGKKLWSRSLAVDFQADDGYFGAGSTPLVVGDKCLVNVGGKGAGLVAFHVATGKTVWQATEEGASYSSPTLANIGGQACAIFVTRFNVVAVNPDTGAERFRFPFGKRGPTVNAATPLVVENQLFVTSSYGLGGLCAQCTPTKASQVWANDDSLSSQYNTPVVHEGHLYGIHGREDQGVAALRCVELATGKIAWSENEFGVAHLILAGDKLLLLRNDGRLTLAPASPVSFKPLAQARVSEYLTRALPALAHGRLYVRDLSGASGAVHCLAVGKDAPGAN